MHQKLRITFGLFTLLGLLACNGGDNANKSVAANNRSFSALYGTPVLDGSASDEVWDQTDWLPIDQFWIGEKTDTLDFQGKYKLLWDESNLYILAEITDDTLIDMHPDGLEKYWDDDCLEIFVDEDASGGNHMFNHSAFAYHISLDGRVVDIAPDSTFRYYDEHCVCRRTTSGNISVWEVAVKLFDGNQYVEGAENIPKLLSQGKKMGFALAYCDNDRSAEREHFIGNVPIEGADKNRAFMDAGVFGALELR